MISLDLFAVLLVGFWLSRRALERRVGMIMFLAVAGFGIGTLVGLWMAWFPNLRRRQRLYNEETFQEGAADTL